jgi:hypothetical protein
MYQCYNLLVLSKHIVMYSIKLLAYQARHNTGGPEDDLCIG